MRCSGCAKRRGQIKKKWSKARAKYRDGKWKKLALLKKAEKRHSK